jgi:hypothetical protein
LWRRVRRAPERIGDLDAAHFFSHPEHRFQGRVHVSSARHLNAIQEVYIDFAMVDPCPAHDVISFGNL